MSNTLINEVLAVPLPSALTFEGEVIAGESARLHLLVIANRVNEQKIKEGCWLGFIRLQLETCRTADSVAKANRVLAGLGVLVIVPPGSPESKHNSNTYHINLDALHTLGSLAKPKHVRPSRSKVAVAARQTSGSSTQGTRAIRVPKARHSSEAVKALERTAQGTRAARPEPKEPEGKPKRGGGSPDKSNEKSKGQEHEDIGWDGRSTSALQAEGIAPPSPCTHCGGEMAVRTNKTTRVQFLSCAKCKKTRDIGQWTIAKQPPSEHVPGQSWSDTIR